MPMNYPPSHAELAQFPHKHPGFVDTECPRCEDVDLDWTPGWGYRCRMCHLFVCIPRTPSARLATPEAIAFFYEHGGDRQK